MCEHNNKASTSSTSSNAPTTPTSHQGEDINNNNNNSSFISSSRSSVSSSKQGASPSKRSYTHNPYNMGGGAAVNNKNNNNNNNHANNNANKKPLSNNHKSPAEIELQRGLDSMLITPDAAQNFHDSNNTLHRSLIGNVSFVPYPTEAVEFDYKYYESTAATPAAFSRVFIGQLPYRVTEMQLQWIFYVFGHGTQIHDPERITKKAKTVGNARVPTGCIHCHIREDKVQGVLQCMHKRLLIDDSGIWYARSEQEQELLEAYIQKLKKQPELRFPDRPYDTMVVQEAVSSYQSSQPRWVSNAPEAEKFAETTPSRKAQILYLQQQKMMKMQQKQQQQQYSFGASVAALSLSGSSNINNTSFHSSTSSHPNESIVVPAATCYNNIMNYNNNHQQQQQHTQQQQFYYQQHQQQHNCIAAPYFQQQQQFAYNSYQR